MCRSTLDMNAVCEGWVWEKDNAQQQVSAYHRTYLTDCATVVVISKQCSKTPPYLVLHEDGYQQRIGKYTQCFIVKQSIDICQSTVFASMISNSQVHPHYG